MKTLTLVYDEKTDKFVLADPQEARMEQQLTPALKQEIAEILRQSGVMPQARMEAAATGFLGKVSSFEVMDIPIGAAALGGSIAFLTDYLTDKILKGKISGSLANLLEAWVLVKFGSRWIGKDTAKYAAMFLVYEAIRDPIESALNGVLGKLPGSTAASSAAGMHQPAVLAQAAQVAQHATTQSDYYAMAFRR